jgi:hypothetical protein
VRLEDVHHPSSVRAEGSNGSSECAPAETGAPRRGRAGGGGFRDTPDPRRRGKGRRIACRGGAIHLPDVLARSPRRHAGARPNAATGAGNSAEGPPHEIHDARVSRRFRAFAELTGCRAPPGSVHAGASRSSKR